jgi:uroporphyrinogen-III synthase
MRVLVTRPKDDAEETAAKLAALGHTPLVAPLIEIRFRDDVAVPLDGVQAVLATSSNGVRALVRHTTRRDIPLFAVGTQTARDAQDAGFAVVRNANGDAHALADATRRWAKPEDGLLVHVAGAERAGHLENDLATHGFKLRTDILYDAEPVRELPSACRQMIEAGALDAVMLFSPRSALAFSACVARANLAERCGRIAAYCISQAAADALAPLQLRAVHVADRPDQEHLLALLA